jgi:hypothetical protein
MIAFFSLLAVAWMVDGLRRVRPRLGLAVLVVIVLVGLLDQTPLSARRAYADNKTSFASDRELVRAIEASLPSGAAIFVLPYVSFPESPSVGALQSNDQLRGYLQSTTLRWSFPTMRGRNGDLFVRETADRPVPEMLRVLALADFNGILVYRDGYRDKGAALEAELRTALAIEPLVNGSDDLAFFDLTGYRRRTAAAAPAPSPGDVSGLLHPIAATYDAGFYDREMRSDVPFNWCQARGEIHLENDLPVVRHVLLSAGLAAAKPPARLEISGDLIDTVVVLDGVVKLARQIDLAPGPHVLRFRCDGQADDAPDPRTMVWRIESLSLQDSPAAPAPGARAP